MNAPNNQFNQLLQDGWSEERLVCVGLDPDYSKLPASVQVPNWKAESMLTFNAAIIDATHDFACAYKPNSAYYEALGPEEGMLALSATIAYIHQNHSSIPVILDVKRGDIGSTSEAYAAAAFDTLGADAATVNPYFGRVALEPFLSRADKGVIVMGANTGDGAGEFQDLLVQTEEGGHEPLYKYICRQVAAEWNQNGNCAVTAGATDPHKVGQIRSVIGSMPILLLGVGTQGGDAFESVQAGIGPDNFGLIINSSRSILYASADTDFDEAARKAAKNLNDSLRAARDAAIL